MKLLNMIKGKKALVILSTAIVIAMAMTAFPLHIEQGNPDNAVLRIGSGEGGYYLTIGNPASAADADYTCDGVADDVTFQTAIDALPSAGGQLFVLAGNYTWSDNTTVTRAIDNVSIIGVGPAVSFEGDGVTAIFTAGGNSWLFSNFETDAGGLAMGATTDWMWLNVFVDTSYYPLRTDSMNIEDHSALHAVGGTDTIFPTDPDADKYLMWDDDPGQLSWEDGGGIGDMDKATYDTDDDGDIDTAAGGTEWDSSGATGVAYITAGAWGTRSTGISNTYIVVVDDADAANGDIPYFTTSGLAGYNEGEFKSAYNMEAGTDYQSYDAELAAIAGLTSAADKLIYFTGAGTADTSDLTAFARSILDDANEATFKATVNLEIGTDVQAWDADLDDIAALSDADSNFIVGNGANWVVESGATVRSSLGLVIGTDVQAYDDELAALAGTTSAADKVPYFTGSGTADVADLTAYGRSLIAVADEAGFKQLVNLEIGTDVLAQQAIGIGDDNLVEMDDADAADDDYARFTPNGLEGRNYSEVVADLQSHLNKIVDPTDQDTLVEAEEDKVTMDVAGVEAFQLSSAGIVTLAKQSNARAYLSSTDQTLESPQWIRLMLDAEDFDVQGEFDTTTNSGTAEAGTSGTTLHDDGVFANAEVGDWVWNTVDHEYTTIASVTSDDEVETADAHNIGVGETFTWYRCSFTVAATGHYLLGGAAYYKNVAADHYVSFAVVKNGSTYLALGRYHTSHDGSAVCSANGMTTAYLTAGDEIEFMGYQNSGGDIDVATGSQATYGFISKLA